MSTYPTVRPSLTLDFQKSKQLDPRITFSRSSTATYVEGGLVKNAYTDQAKFEEQGLLIEEARTNVISYSTAPDNQFNQDSSNFTYTFNQPAPDGSSDAYLMENVSNTSNNRGGSFSNYATIPTTGKITLSVFVKPIGGQVIVLGGDPGNQGYYGVPLVKYDFTVSPPEATTTGNNGSFGFTAEPFIQEIGNGWYRLIEVIDLTNGTGFLNGQTRGPRVANTTPGTSTVVWGYQIETGSFATSYIPTSGSALTRAADVAQITGNNFSSWFNESEGTLTINATDVKEAKYSSALTSSTAGTPDTLALYRKDDDEWRMYHTAQVTFNATGSDANFAAGYSVSGSTRTASAAWKGSLISNVPTDASSIPFTSLQIGTGPKTSGISNGHISRLSYYSERLTDEQLEAITS